MCPWVGSHVPSCGWQLWGLPSRVEYLSPQGVLLPRVYGTIASALWLELRGPTGWQATPSWAVCRHPCHQLLPWLRAAFAVVRDAAWPGLDHWAWSTAPATGPVGRLGCPSASDPGDVDLCLHVRLRCAGLLGTCSPVRTLCAACVCCRWLRPPSSPHLISFTSSFLFLFCILFLFFLKLEKEAHAHCRHRHPQLVQRWCITVFSAVRRRCFVVGRAPGMRLARLDVHW